MRVLLLSLLFVSSMVSGNPPPSDLPTSERYVVYTNGKRDHRMELRLLQMEKQYKKHRYVDYTVNQIKRKGDYEIKRKIDDEIDRLMKKLF